MVEAGRVLWSWLRHPRSRYEERQNLKRSAQSDAPVRRAAAVALLRLESADDGARRSEFVDLYKLMVATSESLVTRRQAVNTFFLSANGAIVTVIGLFLRGSGSTTLKAVAIAALAGVGVLLATAWRSLLLSFGQLNSGKFVVINEMESKLASSIFSAEWEALGRNKNPFVYRTFTSRELWVPNVLAAAFSVALIVALLFAGRGSPSPSTVKRSAPPVTTTTAQSAPVQPPTSARPRQTTSTTTTRTQPTK